MWEFFPSRGPCGHSPLNPSKVGLPRLPTIRLRALRSLHWLSGINKKIQFLKLFLTWSRWKRRHQCHEKRLRCNVESSQLSHLAGTPWYICMNHRVIVETHRMIAVDMFDCLFAPREIHPIGQCFDLSLNQAHCNCVTYISHHNSQTYTSWYYATHTTCTILLPKSESTILQVSPQSNPSHPINSTRPSIPRWRPKDFRSSLVNIHSEFEFPAGRRSFAAHHFTMEGRQLSHFGWWIKNYFHELAW